MNTPIRTLVAFDGQLDPTSVSALVGDPGITVVGVADARTVDPQDNAEAQALVIACVGESPDVLGLIGRASTTRPDRPVIVVCEGSPNGFVREVFDSGADDIVQVAPGMTAGADTFFALQKALVRRAGATQSGMTTGSLICVLGPKGGIGKTMTSANLSVALAAGGHRVAAVDLDLQFGDLGLAMGLAPDRTIYDVVASGGALDAAKVDAYMATHESGARVLLAPIRPDQAGAVGVEFLREIFHVLRASYEYVVVDTPPAFTPEVIATVDESSHICMVGMLDAPSLKNTKLGIETLQLMSYPAERIRIVLNRADTNVGITHTDVLSILGRAPDVMIPSGREVVRSINAGVPLVMSRKGSEQAKALCALADLYIGDRNPQPEPRRGRRLLRRG